MMLRLLVVASIAVAAPRAAGAATHFTVRPHQTHADIGTSPGEGEFNDTPHHLYVPQSPGASPKLVVFLHGRGAEAGNYTEFQGVAAEQGYFVVGLSYPNIASPRDLCGDQTAAPDCYERIRQEVWNGTDAFTGPKVTINEHPKDSIRERLQALFDWLAKPANGHASEGWQQFRNSGEGFEWHRIVLAGHSGGSGFAAFIATRRAVHRVVLFSGPADATNDAHAPISVASWVIPAASALTAPSRYYGLAHAQDLQCEMPVPRIDKIRLSWAILDLPGVVGLIHNPVVANGPGKRGRLDIGRDARRLMQNP